MLLGRGMKFRQGFFKGEEAFFQFSEHKNNSKISLYSSQFDHVSEDTAKPVQFKSIISSSPISKDMVVHCATFDSRQRDGHNNVTVFFITTNRTVLEKDWITGCGVCDQRAKEYKVRVPTEWWWIHGPKIAGRFKYRDLHVLCYDLPVKDGDRAFIIFKPAGASEYVVESDQPARVPPQRIKTVDGYNLSILASLKANSNGAPYIGELILYQKTLGVDHVLFDVLGTYIRDKGLKELIVQHPKLYQYIRSGFVTVDVWKGWYDDEVHEVRTWSESIRKVSTVYKYRDTYDFALTFDTDDFFTPVLADHKNIKYYVKEFCSEYPIGSCMFKWIYYYPEYCGINSTPDDYNLTSALKSLKSKTSSAPKSIHSTAALLDSTFHDARPRHGIPNLMPGYKVVRVDPKYAYVAHIRKFAEPKDKKC